MARMSAVLGSAHEAADGGFVSVGAIEPQFYAELLAGLGLASEELPAQYDRSQWPAMRERFKAIFKTRSRDEWTEVFESRDACVWPLLTNLEATRHPWLAEREVFVEREGIVQPSPAPRFSATPSAISKPPSVPGADTEEALVAWGVERSRIAALRADGALTG